jgi:LysM repeat protein
MESSTQPTRRRGRPSIIARILAALALIGVIVAIVAVVSTNSPKGDDASEGASEKKSRTEQNKKTSPDADTYTVIPGDTLSGIAEKTGTRLTKLQRLNPDLDSESLNAGQVIKLKKDG